jgi:hypothetical protein
VPRDQSHESYSHPSCRVRIPDHGNHRDILNECQKGEIVCKNISNGRAVRGVGTENKLAVGTSYSTQGDGEQCALLQ